MRTLDYFLLFLFMFIWIEGGFIMYMFGLGCGIFFEYSCTTNVDVNAAGFFMLWYSVPLFVAVSKIFR